MDLTSVINIAVQNGFLVTFASTVLYFMIKFGNIYIDRHIKWDNFKLNNDLVMNLVRSVVWYHSRGKLRHIEAILIENNIDTRKDEITRKVRNSLEERTLVYLEYLNTLNTSIKRLWTFYWECFEMDDFFKEIMKIVLRPYTQEKHEIEIAIKLKDISEVMFFYQEKANAKVEEELYRISNNN